MLEQFYNSILPEGQHIVATLDSNTGIIHHYVVDSTEEVIPFLSKFPEFNTYHSLGAYEGLKTGRIKSVKHLEGCTGVKAFAFDIDVGEEKGKYDSLTDAYDALASAIDQGHIPEPTYTLFSGTGLQITYQLRASGQPKILGGHGLSEVVWSARFQQFRAHISQYVKVDRTVGSHPYRLLRSPCTPNWKYEEPVQPQILNEAPGPELDMAWFDTLPEIEETVGNSREDDASLQCANPVGLKKVLKACNAMKEQYEDGGANTSYPVWIATGNICAHTFEFRKGFHRLSKNHPEYSQVATDEKFNEIVNNAASGPFGCDHFGNPDDPDSPCHGCWAAQAGFSNPVSASRHLGSRLKVQAAAERKQAKESLDEVAGTEDVIGDKPEEPDKNGGIPEYHLIEGFESDGNFIMEDGEPICAHFHVKPIQINERRNEGTLQVSKDGKRWTAFPARRLATPAMLTAELFNAAIEVCDDKKTLKYVRHAATVDGQVLERNHFGWSPEFDSIYLPTGIIGSEPTEPSFDLQNLKKKWGKRKGTLEGWAEAVQLYERAGQEPYLMTVLASLASPLLAYHNLEKGVIMSLTGSGGAGKTTALRAATSVWGAPLSTISSMASTFTATRMYLSMCGNLPMVLDEITQMPPEDLKSFALEISQGLGRERAKQDATMAASETWQLICLTTSNLSLHAKLAELIDKGDADMNRVVEIPIVMSEHVSLQQGNELLEGLRQHHGHVGEVFIKHLMTKDVEQERKTFRKLLAKLRATDGMKGSDRFSDGLIVACYWAHKRIKEVMPSFPGDPETQFIWMRKQLRNNNNYIRDILNVRIPDVEDFMMEYSAENLVINKLPGKSGYSSQGQSMKGYLYNSGEWMIVPVSTLQNWCRRNRLEQRTVLARWGQEARLKSMGPDDGRRRWTGKLKGGIELEGKVTHPTVVLIHKGEQYEDSTDDRKKPRDFKADAISFENHRRRAKSHKG